MNDLSTKKLSLPYQLITRTIQDVVADLAVDIVVVVERYLMLRLAGFVHMGLSNLRDIGR